LPNTAYAVAGSGGVVGVDAHVAVGEVAAPDGCLAGA